MKKLMHKTHMINIVRRNRASHKVSTQSCAGKHIFFALEGRRRDQKILKVKMSAGTSFGVPGQRSKLAKSSILQWKPQLGLHYHCVLVGRETFVDFDGGFLMVVRFKTAVCCVFAFQLLVLHFSFGLSHSSKGRSFGAYFCSHCVLFLSTTAVLHTEGVVYLQFFVLVQTFRIA